MSVIEGGGDLLSVEFKLLGGLYFSLFTHYWSCIIVVTYSSQCFWYCSLWDSSITDAELSRPVVTIDPLDGLFETELRNTKTDMITNAYHQHYQIIKWFGNWSFNNFRLYMTLNLFLFNVFRRTGRKHWEKRLFSCFSFLEIFCCVFCSRKYFYIKNWILFKSFQFTMPTRNCIFQIGKIGDHFLETCYKIIKIFSLLSNQNIES